MSSVRRRTNERTNGFCSLSKILFNFVLLLLTIGWSETKLLIEQQWSGGFKAAIEIPITNSINNGWTLEIEFDRSVSLDVRLPIDFSSFTFRVSLGLARRSPIEDQRSNLPFLQQTLERSARLGFHARL